MKDVLVSEKPIMCEKIIVGEKTIIVKKSAPKQVPFKCYIYMTQGPLKDLGTYSDWIYENRMKVIGEFICDNIEKLEEHIEEGGLYYTLNSDFNEAAQLDNWQLHDYGKGKPLYGWHISDLKIYDTPKELEEFKKYYECGNNSCGSCNKCDKDYHLTRPPQAWLYAEEAE